MGTDFAVGEQGRQPSPVEMHKTGPPRDATMATTHQFTFVIANVAGGNSLNIPRADHTTDFLFEHEMKLNTRHTPHAEARQPGWTITKPCGRHITGDCQYTDTMVREPRDTGNWARALPTGLPDWAALVQWYTQWYNVSCGKHLRTLQQRATRL